MNERAWTVPADLAAQADALLANDPLHEHPDVRAYFGDRYPTVLRFAQILAAEGQTRGLLGPREYDRLWERHILNSAAVLPFLPPGTLADVGSGAGLPGLVIAALEPDRRVLLVEPMERRVTWLRDAVDTLELPRVEVIRGRAEEVGIEVDVVTARAVAAIDKLVKWCSPLLATGGSMVLLKGRTAGEELERAKYALRKAKLTGETLEASTLDSLEPTTVVRLTRIA